MIPWDDDIDVGTHLRYRPMIQEALRKLAPNFVTYAQKYRDKLHFKPFDQPNVDPNAIGSHALSKYPWAWPFIDIFYYHQIDRNMAQESGISFRKFNLTDVFPITYRPLGNHWYPAPRRPVSFLRTFYSLNKSFCASHYYSHALERPIRPRFMECRKLHELYAFVHRCPIPKVENTGNSTFFCDEYLVDGKGRPIHKIRTLLDPDEISSPLFNLRHESFKCPD